MIPKKIHFCWLSNENYPKMIEKCIKSWTEKLPDYEFILWDKKRFDININPWCKAAFKRKKYAFVSDYIRFYALYKEGGIYLDSDVEILKNFDNLLKYKSFIGYENSSGLIEPAIIGTEKEQEWCKHILEIYDSLEFPIDRLPYEFIAPRITTMILKREYVNFPINTPSESILLDNDFLLCPPDWFSPITESSKMCFGDKYKSCITENTYAIHHFNGSWTNYRIAVKFFRTLGVYDYILKIWNVIHNS